MSDSMLDGTLVIRAPSRRRSRSLEREAVTETIVAGEQAKLKAPKQQRSRSLSKERITQRVKEKLAQQHAHEQAQKQLQKQSLWSASAFYRAHLRNVDGQAMRQPQPEWDWAERGSSHVEFHKDESPPFKELGDLGHGVNGPVVEVAIKGVRVALKRIYCRQGITQKQLKEIEILKRLKHRHIIEVMGSYTRGKYLGILLYPVATCDLAIFLEDFNYLRQTDAVDYNIQRTTFAKEEFQERSLRCATVCGLRDLDSHSGVTNLHHIVVASKARLWRSYRCIASAIQHLHKNSVRHKDLKPHNVLLSPEGLWVTDFGMSTDFSGISNSNTSGGDRGTIKYCAPEVAAFQSSGRSADIYSLGCLFFEMAAAKCFTPNEMRKFRPLMDGSFHNNSEGIASAFVNFGDETHLGHLPMGLARTMIVKSPGKRPDIATVVQNLDLIQAFSKIETDAFPGVSCCPQPFAVPIFPASFTVDVSVTVGNTCQLKKAESAPIDGEDRMRTPIVVFVDCSYEGIIDRVIFFQHCSSETPFITVTKHPFARSGSLWGLYAQAMIVVLKSEYTWDSPFASQLFLHGDTVAKSVMPLTWGLQVEKIYDSRSFQFRVRW